nr:hypothetical protein [uncultured Enterobacter sp.]
MSDIRNPSNFVMPAIRTDVFGANVPMSSYTAPWGTEGMLRTTDLTIRSTTGVCQSPSRSGASDVTLATPIHPQRHLNLFSIIGDSVIPMQSNGIDPVHGLARMLVQYLSEHNPEEVKRYFQQLLNTYLSVKSYVWLNVQDAITALVFLIADKQNWTHDYVSLKAAEWAEEFLQQHRHDAEQCALDIRSQIAGNAYTAQLAKVFMQVSAQEYEAKLNSDHPKRQYPLMLASGERYLTHLLGERDPALLADLVVLQHDQIVYALQAEICRQMQSVAMEKHAWSLSKEGAVALLDKHQEYQKFTLRADTLKKALRDCPVDNTPKHVKRHKVLRHLVGPQISPLPDTTQLRFNPTFISAAGRLLMYACCYPVPTLFSSALFRG